VPATHSPVAGLLSAGTLAPLVRLSCFSNLDIRAALGARARRSGASQPDSACDRNADGDPGSTTAGRTSTRSFSAMVWGRRVLSGLQIVPPRCAGRRPRRCAGGCAVSLAVAQAAPFALPSVAAALREERRGGGRDGPRRRRASLRVFALRVSIRARGQRAREKNGVHAAAAAALALLVLDVHKDLLALAWLTPRLLSALRMLPPLLLPAPAAALAYTWRLTTMVPTKGVARTRARGSRAMMTTMMSRQCSHVIMMLLF
jgi:hypothetical protein